MACLAPLPKEFFSFLGKRKVQLNLWNSVKKEFETEMTKTPRDILEIEVMKRISR